MNDKKMTKASTTDVSLVLCDENPSPNRSDVHVLLSDLPRRGLFLEYCEEAASKEGRYVLTTVLEACNITLSTKLKVSRDQSEEKRKELRRNLMMLL